MDLQISSPGKLVLFGEVSVLYGFKAVSLSISERMVFNIKLCQSLSPEISITSNTFNFTCRKSDLDVLCKNNELNKDFRICIHCIKIVNFFSFNFDIHIDILSNIPNGLGSSGALIANFSTLYFFLKNLSNNSKFIKNYKKFNKDNLDKIFKIAVKISDKIYKKYSSHIDIATSIYGNIIFYKKGKVIKILKKDNVKIKDFFLFKLEGKKKDAKFTANLVEKNNSKNKKIEIFKKIDKISRESFNYLIKNDFEKLSLNINNNQLLLENLSILDKNTTKIKQILAKYDINNFKTSGTGFGDFGFSIDKKIDKICDKIQEKESLVIKKISIGDGVKLAISSNFY